MIVPVVLLILSLVFIGVKYNNTGNLFERDVSLKGGVSATIYTDKEIDVVEAELALTKELGTDAFVRELRDFSTNKIIGYVVDIGEIKDDFDSVLEGTFGVKLIEGDNFESNSVGSTLGDNFYKDMLKAILIAFFLMGIVVFIAFRTVIPSLAVILSAILDIAGTLVIINLLELKISIAGIAAFLLVIGYSVDTDILMTTKVLKRREGGSTIHRLIDSAKTGLTMSVTTFVALGVGYIVTSSLILKEMFLIILIALIIDVISTYGMNAGILYWYKEKKFKGQTE
jgi:preprotein translocase subunit SecF